MITYSIIQKSKLEGALRLDAEYYQPEFLELVEKLQKIGTVPIRDVVINPKRKFMPQKGKAFDYIEISEIDLSTGEYNKTEILGENVPDRAQWIVEQNDVIVSMVRPIRNAVSLIREDNKNLVCSSGFAVLKTEKVEPEYLFVYLKSRPIVKLLDRKTTATMYPAITINNILETKIYLGDKNFREEIKNKVKEAQKELEFSKSFYSQAENLLLEELGLSDFNIEDEIYNIVKLSEIKKANRIDAEYFQPKYEEIIKKIENYKNGWDYVKNIINFKDKNFFPKEDEKYKYLALSNISGQGYVQNSQEEFGKDLPTRARRKINTGDVIISSIEGSLDSCALIENEFDNAICSTGFFVVNSEKINPETLLIIFKSKIIQELLIRGSKGTILTAISKDELNQIKIPLIKSKIQKQIAEKIQESHKLRKEAKELLEKAKSKVENLIEK